MKKFWTNLRKVQKQKVPRTFSKYFNTCVGLEKDKAQMKFMIVDDNTGMREMIRDVACKENDTVLECSDGVEAVSAFSKFHPDYVLMDIEMKEMDGFTASENIYKQDPTAKIIFVTSHNTSAFRLKAKTMHAAGFVTKENLSELNQLLHH